MAITTLDARTALLVIDLQQGGFDLRATDDAIVSGLGMLLTGVLSARAFGRFHGGNSPGDA